MSILRKIFGDKSSSTEMENIAKQVALEYCRTVAANPQWSLKQVADSLGQSFGSMPVYTIGLTACVCSLTERITGADPRTIWCDQLMKRMGGSNHDEEDSTKFENPVHIISRILLAGGVPEELLNPNSELKSFFESPFADGE